MLSQTTFACGPADEVLTEANLRLLYGVDLKRVVFDHAGKTLQTFVPVLLIPLERFSRLSTSPTIIEKL